MTGEPLVLIHGAGGTPRQWAPVVPLLTDTYELLVPTLIGHRGGRPLSPTTPVSIDTLVDGVETDMDAAGLRTGHVAGTSLGAWIAFELAKRGRARTCTAIAPATWPAGDHRIRVILALYRTAVPLARLISRDPDRWTRRPGMRRLLYGHHLAHPERLRSADAAALTAGLAGCTIMPSLVASIAAQGGPRGLDQIRCPVQLVFADQDHVLPPRRYAGALTAALPSACAYARSPTRGTSAPGINR